MTCSAETRTTPLSSEKIHHFAKNGNPSEAS